jgi:mannose-6-phosphate isomerase-like protein (cupin superfamily)
MKQETGTPTAAISRETAEHYVWGNGCDGWHLLKDAHLSVIEECMPPSTSEIRHRHQKAQQFFFMLSGEAVMDVEGRPIPLSIGHGLRIPPGIRHQIRNDSTSPARFLVISQPPSHGDRIPE